MANDPWLAGTWQVFDGQGGGGLYLKPHDRPGCFNLVAVLDSVEGDTAFYRVDHASCDMPDCWRTARFLPRGNLPVPALSTQLPPWKADPTTAEQWLEAAKEVRKQVKPSTKRLEGDIRPVGDAESLTLVLVENAVIDGSDLLVLVLTAQYATPREDG